jgi:hypothetical protein
MDKLCIESVDGGTRLVISLSTRYDAFGLTVLGRPRPSSRPPPPADAPAVRLPRPPPLPRMLPDDARRT